nr:TPS1 [Erythropodium caribaeorum]
MSHVYFASAPAAWVKHHKEILSQPSDENLIQMDKMIKWATSCGVANETGVRKSFNKLNAYVYLRCMYPLVPPDPWSAEMFRINLHFTTVGYIVDDRIEGYTMEEMTELCDAYDMLEREIKDKFPDCPSIEDMNNSLQLVRNKFSRAAVTMVMDFVNQSALFFLRQGKTSRERVTNFRRRLSNAVTIYYQAIRNKVKMGSHVSEGEMLWRRCFDVLAVPSYLAPESFTAAIETGEWPIRELYELYIFGILYSTVINDLYSFHREKLNNCDNVIKVWFREESVSSIHEANEKICQILDAIMQYMYQKIEETKAKYRQSQELKALLDYTGYVTAGWIFVHNKAAPRYLESPYQITLKEIPDAEISGWLKSKTPFGWSVIDRFIDKMNSAKGKAVMDALCGFTDGNGVLM